MPPTPLQILLSAYWGKDGWIIDPAVSPEDRRIAEEAGFMFPPEVWKHDHAASLAIRAVTAADKSAVTRSYLVGLSGADLAVRSALASYANGLSLRVHRYVGRYGCNECGFWKSQMVDFNVMNFERYKFGGVRHASPEFIAFDLREFEKLQTEGDCALGVEILRDVLRMLNQLPADARASTAEKALQPLLGGNQNTRRAVLQTLGYCGVLRSKGSKPIWQHWYSTTERDPPPKPHKNDWSYPVSWWTGSDGVDMGMARFWFGEHGFV